MPAEAVQTDQINIAVEPAVKRMLQRIAAKERLRLSDIGRRAFDELIERHEEAARDQA